MYNDVLAELNRVFNGSTMNISSTADRVLLTSKNGFGYEYLDIILEFQDDCLGIRGYADGCEYADWWLSYDAYKDVDSFLDDVNENVISIFGEVNECIIRNMFN